MSGAEPDLTIEVGASDQDGTLRLWRAKEAMRQGEARLGAQIVLRTALEARATAITGWAAASLLAIAAAGASSGAWQARTAAGIAGCLLFAAASTGIHIARPREFSVPGYDPMLLMFSSLATELEVVESLAVGLNDGLQSNSLRLIRMATVLRWAGWMLIVAPIAAVAAYVTLIAAS